MPSRVDENSSGSRAGSGMRECSVRGQYGVHSWTKIEFLYSDVNCVFELSLYNRLTSFLSFC